MSRKLTILLFLFSTIHLAGQDSLEYEIVVNGSIGNFEMVTLEDVIIELDSTVVFSDSSGKAKLKTNQEKIRIKINHPGFSKIDTTLQTTSIDYIVEFLIFAVCDVNKELARNDLGSGRIRLFLASGIAPTIVKGQDSIADKFGFVYEDFGCVGPPTECIIQYNTEIFSYLDSQFGGDWRTQIRPDVIGLKNYLKQK